MRAAHQVLEEDGAMNDQVSDLLKRFVAEYVVAARADRYHWIFGASCRPGRGEQGADDETQGLELLQSAVKVITLVVAYRTMDRAVNEAELAWTRHFLELQRYGATDEARGAIYEVFIPGCLDAPLFVGAVADLDFEDLHDALCFDRIIVIHLRGDFDDEAARAVAATIHEDLNNEEAVDTWWQHSGDTVLVGIEPEPGDEEGGGVQRHRGPLIVG